MSCSQCSSGPCSLKSSSSSGLGLSISAQQSRRKRSRLVFFSLRRCAARGSNESGSFSGDQAVAGSGETVITCRRPAGLFRKISMAAGSDPPAAREEQRAPCTAAYWPEDARARKGELPEESPPVGAAGRRTAAQWDSGCGGFADCSACTDADGSGCRRRSGCMIGSGRGLRSWEATACTILPARQRRENFLLLRCVFFLYTVNERTCRKARWV